jgi:hypothetical protein
MTGTPCHNDDQGYSLPSHHNQIAESMTGTPCHNDDHRYSLHATLKSLNLPPKQDHSCCYPCSATQRSLKPCQCLLSTINKTSPQAVWAHNLLKKNNDNNSTAFIALQCPIQLVSKDTGKSIGLTHYMTNNKGIISPFVIYNYFMIIIMISCLCPTNHHHVLTLLMFTLLINMMIAPYYRHLYYH